MTSASDNPSPRSHPPEASKEPDRILSRPLEEILVGKEGLWAGQAEIQKVKEEIAHLVGERDSILRARGEDRAAAERARRWVETAVGRNEVRRPRSETPRDVLPHWSPRAHLNPLDDAEDH